MKKSIVLFMILTVFLLTGCSQKEQMTSFIPTQTPEEVSDNTTPEDTSGEDAATEGTEATPTPKEIHVGQTTPMYVKLDKYGAFLNIRPTPSTDSEPVGFLVHAEEIDVIEIADGWASFLYNNAICYVNSDFLVDERPEYLEPPTATPAPTPKATPTPKASSTPKATSTPTPVAAKPDI
jgi:hypothetical protein